MVRDRPCTFRALAREGWAIPPPPKKMVPALQKLLKRIFQGGILGGKASAFYLPFPVFDKLLPTKKEHTQPIVEEKISRPRKLPNRSLLFSKTYVLSLSFAQAYSICTTCPLLVDRSSLKFVQEVQEAKAMDDLMDKIDKLMGGGPGTEHTGTGETDYLFNHTYVLELSIDSIKFAPLQGS